MVELRALKIGEREWSGCARTRVSEDDKQCERAAQVRTECCQDPRTRAGSLACVCFEAILYSCEFVSLDVNSGFV